jgi:hypothetical protein
MPNVRANKERYQREIGLKIIEDTYRSKKEDVKKIDDEED